VLLSKSEVGGSGFVPPFFGVGRFPSLNRWKQVVGRLSEKL